MSEFFAMGGHGPYIWLSYGITLLVLLALAWRQRRLLRQFQQQANARAQRAGVHSSQAAQTSAQSRANSN